MTKLIVFLLFLQIPSIVRAEEEAPHSPPMADQEDVLTKIVEAIRQGHVKAAEEQITQLGDTAPISQIVHDVYARTESNIELLVNLTTSLSDASLGNQILTVLREELKRSRHNDIRNLIVVAKAYKREIIANENFTSTKPNPSLSELLHEISDVASAFLVSVMQSDASYVTNEDVRSLAAALAELPTVSSMVMQSLVADCFFAVDKDRLLEGVYSHSNTWQALQGLYQFFWWLEAAPLKGNIVLKHAYLLSETMKRKDFANIDPMEKYSIDKMVGKIPACARNLFFEPSFCVWNKHQNSFMTAEASQAHDAQRRNIFTSPRTENGTVPSGSSWRVTRTGDKLYFANVAFPNENLFVADAESDAGARHVYSWIPSSNSDERSAWSVELDGANCFLRNLHSDEYLSSSDASHGSVEHKYVLAMRRDEPKATSSAFVWRIRSCCKDPL